MKYPKLFLGSLIGIILVVVAIFAFVSFNAKAQGLVEYSLICLEDLGAPPDPNLVDYDALKSGFGVPSWPGDWGVFISCTPKFSKSTGEFNKLRFCSLAYQDVNSNGHLDFGDIKKGEICSTIKE